MTVGGEPWYADAVFYELPVKAFFDGNNDGVGDFVGLTRKLDYLAELGVTCVWLLPFYPSPLRDDGYDVTDYRAVHPAYGTLDDFRAFVEAAHGRGLRVVIEVVVNHTSDEHPWFQAARAAPAGSPLRDFYVWSERDDKFEQARARAAGGPGARWAWDPVARAYYWHRFFEHQPDLNYGNPLVRAEMLRVLRFWLDLGVDGLCLNGAAYLFKRDGTSCEHLPETHDFLKEARREVEAAYPGRMLQAGVNAWPTEVRPYFGAGDECQLAPHLALAQRLFLAARQEDRHPLAEVLRQTPALPPGCQWVLLLRNHDELTLGLATDEERDYMYREYADDPRMRLHAGIRRRLAPLLDNNRGRIELLFGLLFSLPGAPVLYYGDEIGMGDNVYLGDRAGVRTPMQWAADPNAGFSAASPDRLYCPPVMNPVFGAQSVNVEAQRRDPSSLFHWLRRLIALRKGLRPLSGPGLELLEPANRKVFAYVRRHDGEVFLGVANLSRSVQPVELDLSALAGLVPVEVVGRTAFPRVGPSPYFLTLGPHAFYWFLLQEEPHDVSARTAPVRTEEAGAVPALEVPAGRGALFTGAARQALERSVLPGYLRAQRWFGGKARRIESVRVTDWGAVPGAAQAFLALLEVRFADGAADLYFLPLAVTSGPRAAHVLQSMRSRVLARLTGPGGDAVLHDALASDEVCAALLAAVAEGREVALQSGRVRAFTTGAFAALRGPANEVLPPALGPETSSNSLVFFGRRLLLKLFRRLEVGTNPDFEVGRFLTESGAFDRIPKVAGAVEYRRPDGEHVTLAILQERVDNQGDGWGHAIDELGRYFERASGRMHGPDAPPVDERPLTELAEAAPPPAVREAIGPYLHAAATLGRRTAEMHLALASGRDPAFAPEPMTAADVTALAQEIQAQGRRALDGMREGLSKLPEALAPAARQFLEKAPAVLRRWAEAPGVRPGPLKARCHGDYHLGQVLWVQNDFVILDFEGEPTRTVEERRARQSPLKDVAGMLRSFDYAAYAGLFAFTQNHPDDFAPLAPWAELWRQWVSAAFLREYRAAAGAAGFLPSEPAQFAALLDAFTLAKAFYELVYELNNRPDWVRIPLRGILSLIEQKSAVRCP